MSVLAIHGSSGRSSWQGVGQILRFNWPMYAGAMMAIGVVAAVVVLLRPSAIIAGPVIGLAGLVAWWSIASLVVSHWVYDRAGLYDLEWTAGVVRAPGRCAMIHAGLDEFSPHLRRRFGAPVAVVDIYDPARMTEPSISRARTCAVRDAMAVRGTHDHLPLEDGGVDGAFVLFAAHELRTPEERAVLFGEIRRSLAGDGRVVVVEHLRDWWGWVAFGPGAMHFFSRAAWLGAFAAAGLAVERERSITPFARVFVLRRES